MQLTMRAYRDENDYWRIREFLRTVLRCNDRHSRSWDVVRFDYWRWHGNENIEHHRLEEVIFLWETGSGQIAAVLNPEGKGEAFLQIHPNFRTPQLEEQMIGIAEQHLAAPTVDGRRQLCLWANSDDAMRQELLKGRGYRRGDWPEYQRRRPMSLPIPEGTVASGYSVRALGDYEELRARSVVSWQAFHPNERMTNMQAGHGIATCSVRRSIVAISILWQWRPGGNSPRFVRFGLTMPTAWGYSSQWGQPPHINAAVWAKPSCAKDCDGSNIWGQPSPQSVLIQTRPVPSIHRLGLQNMTYSSGGALSFSQRRALLISKLRFHIMWPSASHVMERRPTISSGINTSMILKWALPPVRQAMWCPFCPETIKPEPLAKSNSPS